MNDYCEIVKAVWLEGYRVRVTFNNLRTAVLDLGKYLGRGIFKELRKIEKFKQLRVDAELGTIVWPNGADIAPEVLYRDSLLIRKVNIRVFAAPRRDHAMAVIKEPARKYGKKK